MGKVKSKELLESLGIFSDINLKNITRVGNERVKDGWWLRTNRDGKKVSKTFSDEDHNDSPFMSLKEAIRHRDKIKSKRVESNTGYFSLSISIYSGNKSPMVRANYKKEEEKSFSIASYGYLSALREAMQWLNGKGISYYNKCVQLDIDMGLTYLNKNLETTRYLKILEKTLIDKENGGLGYTPSNKKNTILIIASPTSHVISKNPSFTYSKYIKDTLGFIRTKKFDFQIENTSYDYNEKEYYAVVQVDNGTSSKEFCFRVRKLVELSSKEFYTIRKSAPFFKTIYDDNPSVKKDIINKIPDFQSREEFAQYLESEKKKNITEKKELFRKKNANLSNSEYVKRKDKQIGWFSKIIHDYERLIQWNAKGDINADIQ